MIFSLCIRISVIWAGIQHVHPVIIENLSHVYCVITYRNSRAVPSVELNVLQMTNDIVPLQITLRRKPHSGREYWPVFRFSELQYVGGQVSDRVTWKAKLLFSVLFTKLCKEYLNEATCKNAYLTPDNKWSMGCFSESSYTRVRNKNSSVFGHLYIVNWPQSCNTALSISPEYIMK